MIGSVAVRCLLRPLLYHVYEMTILIVTGCALQYKWVYDRQKENAISALYANAIRKISYSVKQVWHQRRKGEAIVFYCQ